MVVGGGAVATRKVSKLLQAGAEVVVVSPEVRPELEDMDVEVHDRAYEYGDLEGADLAFAATDSREVNAAVAREAKERGVRINVADRPSEGDFAVPSTLQEGWAAGCGLDRRGVAHAGEEDQERVGRGFRTRVGRCRGGARDGPTQRWGAG